MKTVPRTQVGYILRSYPRLSQTFILHEILALEQLGLDLRIFAITNPREPTVHNLALVMDRGHSHNLSWGDGDSRFGCPESLRAINIPATRPLAQRVSEQHRTLRNASVRT